MSRGSPLSKSVSGVPRARALALLLLSMILAGCVGSEEPVDGVATMVDENGEVIEVGQSRDLDGFVSLSEDRSILDASDAFSGSFDPTQHGFPQNLFLGPANMPSDNFVTHDITHLIPVGIPTVVSSTMTTQGASQPSLFHWIGGPNEVFWTYDNTNDGKGGQVDTVVARGHNDVVTANVWYGHVQANDVSYEISTTTRASPTWFPAAILWSLELGPGEAVELIYSEVPGAEPLWVWDPEDAFLGKIAANGKKASLGVADADPGGEYVFFVPEFNPGHHFRLTDLDGEPLPDALLVDRLRILDQVIETAVNEAVPQGEMMATATMAVPVQPVQVGYSWFSPTASHDVETMFSGDGTEIHRTTSPDPAIGGSGGFFNTDMGPPDIKPGSYELMFHHGGGADYTISMWYVTHGR